MSILIVDDEVCICDLMESVLTENYKVIKTYFSKDVLDLARKHLPKLIISDIMMPGLDGLELLAVLRADPRTKTIPIILISAAATPISAGGADAFLQKPFEIEALEKLISRFLPPSEKTPLNFHTDDFFLSSSSPNWEHNN